MAYQKLQSGKAKAVTPSNTADIFYSNAGDNQGCVLYVGTEGSLKVKTVSGDEVTFVGIQAGSFLPIQVLRVFATGTNASNIIALW